METYIRNLITNLNHRNKLAAANNDIHNMQLITAQIEILRKVLVEAGENSAPQPSSSLEKLTSKDQTVAEALSYMENKSLDEIEAWLDPEEDRKTILKAVEALKED